jgi:hypothetical protein
MRINTAKQVGNLLNRNRKVDVAETKFIEATIVGYTKS